MDWFLIPDISNILNDVMYTFTTTVCSPRTMGLPLIIIYSYFLIYFMMGIVYNTYPISSLQMNTLQQDYRNNISTEQYPLSTLVRLDELQLFRYYLILIIEYLNLEGIDWMFMIIRQFHWSPHIHSAIDCSLWRANYKWYKEWSDGSHCGICRDRFARRRERCSQCYRCGFINFNKYKP
jgi:hypothetical protein